MTLEAQLVQCGEMIDWTADADTVGGTVIQLRDGRAGVVSVDVTSGNVVGVYTEGIFKVLKTASIVLLSGGHLYWDHSANKAHFKSANDRDFFLGALTADAASADTTCYVNLNVRPVSTLSLGKGYRSLPIMTTLGSARLHASGAEGVQMILGAASEAQKVDALSYDGMAIGAKAIVEFRLTVVDGDASTAADFNVGLANGTHATDADSITEHLFLHVDGNSTNLNLQSKDGTTTVASTDTTLDYVAGTAVEVWFDCRDLSDIQVYIDGVNVLPSSVFKLNGAAGPLKLLAHLEKTATTDTGNLAVDWLRARIAQV